MPGGALSPRRPQISRGRQAEAELEVVGVGANRIVVAGEAHWTREPIGFCVFSHLRDVVRHVPGVGNDTELVLFGRRFDSRLKAAAYHAHVRLVSSSDLFKLDLAALQ